MMLFPQKSQKSLNRLGKYSQIGHVHDIQMKVGQVFHPTSFLSTSHDLLAEIVFRARAVEFGHKSCPQTQDRALSHSSMKR